MADLYPYRHSQTSSSSSSSSYPTSVNIYPTLPGIDQHQQQQQQQQQHGSVTPPDDHSRDDGDGSSQRPLESPKSETKPQATFLTKLYALLERPENHHMIRWDTNGDHIIVERPEQLALHVLPSVYRQSRFASFSRQLNIYGFMRKVNLRNVDPAIDDPDASTWSHPTLNRHSPPEVVANFKRRVPPRLPKPRKRSEPDPTTLNVPRSAAAAPLGQLPMGMPSSAPGPPLPFKGRSRGFSAPGSFNPLAPPPGSSSWGASSGYQRPALPPLTVPSDPPSHPGLYHPLTHGPPDDTPQTAFHPSGYPSHGLQSSRDSSNVYIHNYPYQSESNWGFHNSQINLNASSPSNLSSLLNPSVPSQPYQPSRPTVSTHLSPVASYPSPFSAVPVPSHGAPGSSMSPDSRPTTGYSTSYDDSNSMDLSRPGTGNRPLTPASVISGGRPGSSQKNGMCIGQNNTLSIRRGRRHSQAVNPYPSPYDMSDQRPLTAPSGVDNAPMGMARTKSLMQLPSVESYCFNPAQADFAYSANGPSTSSVDSMESSWMSTANNATSGVRPSTAHSTMSAASHSSASGAHTPPMDTFEDTDINRFSPDFGYLALNAPPRDMSDAMGAPKQQVAAVAAASF